MRHLKQKVGLAVMAMVLGMQPIVAFATAPVLASALSRKHHTGSSGDAGVWDINVSAGDIECRSAQMWTASLNELKIIAIFDIDVVAFGGTSAVTTDTGIVGAVTQIAPTALEIDITGITDIAPYGTFNTQVNLGFANGMNGGVVDANFPTDPTHASQSTLCIRIIVGDYDNNGRANFLDFAKVKNIPRGLNRLVISVDEARADFDCGGRPNLTDFSKVKTSGLINQTAPACGTPIGP